MTAVAELVPAVRRARQLADREAGEARSVGKQGKAAQAEVARLAGQLTVHEQVLGVLTKVGEERQEFVQRQLEGYVTQALQAIFGEELSFHLVTSVKANRTEIDFVLRSDYDGTRVDTSVLDARGGGMAAVVGFVLRLVVLLLSREVRPVLFLDETFGMVSAEYEPRLAEFLREVTDKGGVQITLITHSHAYDDAADQAYFFKLGADGITQVEEAGGS